jgi:hypothetical protein
MLETLSRCWGTLVIRGAAGALAVVVLIAVYAIVFGVALGALGPRLRRAGEATVPGSHQRPATA